MTDDGVRAVNSDLPEADQGWWAAHLERLERAARESAGA